MKITEIMSAKVDELKKEIVDAIDNLLIAKGAEEIELQEIVSILDDYLVYKYNVKDKSITFCGTEPFNIFESGVNELMDLLKEVEEETYEITK
jgi:hypothetical protein